MDVVRCIHIFKHRGSAVRKQPCSSTSTTSSIIIPTMMDEPCIEQQTTYRCTDDPFFRVDDVWPVDDSSCFSSSRGWVRGLFVSGFHVVSVVASFWNWNSPTGLLRARCWWVVLSDLLSFYYLLFAVPFLLTDTLAWWSVCNPFPFYKSMAWIDERLE